MYDNFFTSVSFIIELLLMKGLYVFKYYQRAYPCEINMHIYHYAKEWENLNGPSLMKRSVVFKAMHDIMIYNMRYKIYHTIHDIR